jgi:pyrimidine-nucleoside phosphorylase/thymidine phosphorylase
VNFVEVIAKKRDNGHLSGAEVDAFVRGASTGTLPDEQLAAMLMAICIRGADPDETQALVEAMRDSGARWRIGEEFPGAVDKHSTGGVGDSVSLPFAPLVAACGVPVVMMAGAGLGHTQGTLDKLAAIPGFAPARSRREAVERIDGCGVAFAAQSEEIAPADKRLYLLRDVTGTVPSLPLIVASVMSKKLAVGAAKLVLDVKCGSGAFCKTVDVARSLAGSLVQVGSRAGVAVTALLTDMSEPLGDRLGCANEVRAALDVLSGGGDRRLRELTLELAVEALLLVGRDRGAARAELERRLADGSALTAWERLVEAHGGDPAEDQLARPRSSVPVPAGTGGWITAVDGEALGWIAVALGAGRRSKDDPIDLAAGVGVSARIGDRVEPGQTLATLELGARPAEISELAARAVAAFSIGPGAPARRPLVMDRLPGAVQA